MKRIIGFLIACNLLFLISSVSLGAIHPVDMASVDTWYSIEPDSPFAQFTYNRPSSDFNLYTVFGEYYQNDHTFLGATYTSNDPLSTTLITGSYLFDFGLFVGLGYQNVNMGSFGSITNLQVSPGYRWNLDNDNSYIALSFDYLNSNPPSPIPGESKITSYDLDAKYYTDTMKFVGEVLINDGSSDIQVDLEGAWKLTDALTVGGELFSASSTNNWAEVGFTYSPESYIFDAKAGVPYGQPMYYSASFMYQLTKNFYAGLEADADGTGDIGYTLKARCLAKQSQFLFEYGFPTNNANGSSYQLMYITSF